MKALIDHVIRALTDWFTRQKSVWYILLRTGVLILLPTIGSGFLLKINLTGWLNIELDTAQDLPKLITLICFLVAVALILTGATGMVVHGIRESKLLNRKKIIIIEQRGLRDTSDTPLENFIPTNLKGRKESLIQDVRQRIKDGVVIDPYAALDQVNYLPEALKSKTTGFAPSELSLVYGGIMPVPLTFLTGVLIDDESGVLILDWNRDKNSWQILNSIDDQKRFSSIGPTSAITTEAILAISVSYRTDIEGIKNTLPGIPILELVLEDGNTSSHWSEDKQQELTKQFRESIITLSNLGVKRIHLFLAAPNSLVFRFGRAYDKRNLPEVIVYQYERTATPPFPWGVQMPTHGISKASIFKP